MQPFVNVFLGILQNFLKLSKKEYLQGAASGVNIWIRTIIFTAKILQTTTGISVIFIIRISVLQLHIFFATTTFSRFGLSLSMTAVFWVWALLCALGLRRYYIIAYLLRHLITVIPQRDESSSFLFTFPTRYTWITLLYILIQCTQ